MIPAADEFDQTRPPVTDVPWFWVLVFSAAALVALVLIWPQYAKRQRRLEMQYQAHEEMTRRRVTGEARAREPGKEGDAPPPAVGELIIPLWPLLVVLVGVIGVSAHMLRRARATVPVGPGARPGGDAP